MDNYGVEKIKNTNAFATKNTKYKYFMVMLCYGPTLFPTLLTVIGVCV